MGLLNKITSKAEEARAKEKIKPLLESRMMRDILMEIGQRGNEPLDLQSVPSKQRKRAMELAQESGLAGMKQSVVSEIALNSEGIALTCGDDKVEFLYSDYNYEDIADTDCLLSVAQSIVQHMRGYYSISRTVYTVPDAHGHNDTTKTREVFIRRHHEDTPFELGPVKKQSLF